MRWFFCSVLVLMVVCSNAIAQDDKIQSWSAEAQTLMQREQFEAALRLYDNIIEATDKDDPAHREAQYNRIVCLYSLEDLDTALEEINSFIGENPGVIQGKVLRAFIYRDMGDTQAQLQDVSDLVAMNPLNADLIKWQAYLLIQEEEYDSARAQLHMASRIKTDAETELYLGMTHYFTDDPDSALYHFDNAIDLQPDAFPALMYASAVCLDQSAYELALSYLDKAALLDPTNLSVVFYKGIALTETGQRDEGCRYLSRAFYGGEDAAGAYLEHKCFRYDPN